MICRGLAGPGSATGLGPRLGPLGLIKEIILPTVPADSETENLAASSLGPLEKKLVYLLSGDLGLSARPYLELAGRLGLAEEKVLEMVDDFQRRGLIRRLGAVVVHQRSGFKANAMVVWEIAESDLDRAGNDLAAMACVSHCYWRPAAGSWPYNLYTMVHARSRDELLATVGEMTAVSGAASWKVLESVRELKKTSLRYFHEARGRV